MRADSSIMLEGIEYITIKTYANDNGITYEAVRQKIKTLMKSGKIKEKDIPKIGGCKYLSPDAVDQLDRYIHKVVLIDSKQSDEYEALNKKYNDLVTATGKFAETINAQEMTIIKLMAENKALSLEKAQLEVNLERLEDKAKKGIWGKIFNKP